MRQCTVRAINSSPQIFNPSPQPQPGLHTLNFPTLSSPKSMPSIPKHARKISRRDLTICAPSLSFLIQLGACCDVAFDAFRARADEVPSDVGNGRGEENSNADSEVRPDGSQTSIRNGRDEENATSNGETTLSNDGPSGANGGINEIPNVEQEVGSNTNANECGEKTATQRAFLDISIDGETAGRIIIGLYRDNAPAAVVRFSGLVSGIAGISYKRKEFVKIMPNYIQHGGVRSYGVDSALAQRTGSNLAVDSLVREWEKLSEKCPGTRTVAGTVGIVVRDPSKPPPKLKLVARKGKLAIDQEEVGKDPNGTEFVITTKDSPELDSSTLVIGKVVEGMDVVEKISKVKSVQENTSSPYFRIAKLIGDKRAVVAERGFNRPYSKVIITNCGLMN